MNENWTNDELRENEIETFQLPIAKHSGLKEISSIATSPFEENPLDASNCKKYLEIDIKEIPLLYNPVA